MYGEWRNASSSVKADPKKPAARNRVERLRELVLRSCRVCVRINKGDQSLLLIVRNQEGPRERHRQHAECGEGPHDAEQRPAPGAAEDAHCEGRVAARDDQEDVGVVDAAEHRLDLHAPVDAVVQRARAEQQERAGEEDRRAGLGGGTVGRLVGAGGATGSLDASNMFKPALARGEIQCIGATTFDEYKKHLEKDAALVRRFQKIILKEPTQTETIEILNNLKSSYETFHKVQYEDNVVETIVKLSNRYITDRQFPDKAIDVLDELGSEKRVSSRVPESIDNLKKDIEEIKEKKIQVVKTQKYEEAAKLRDEERKLVTKLEDEKQKWAESLKENKTPVTIDDVYDII